MKRAQAVSIKVVAERAGVSAATVSNVINGKSSVSRRIIDRVTAIADELGYVADSNASRLRSGRHALAGVVVPDLTNPMFSSFVSTLERLARVDGFDLLVVSSANSVSQEAERLRSIRSWRPAGLIVIPCDGALSARLPKAETHRSWSRTVFPDDDAFDLVAVDNARSAGAVAEHLAASGFKSCLVAGSMLSISNVRERWEGAVAARQDMAMSMVETGIDRAGIHRHLHDRLSRSSRPAALFTLDHVTALVAYEVLAGLGLRVPSDIAMASFDETEWMRLVTPPITVVRQPVETMAETAWAQLRRRMAGESSTPPETQRLSCAIEIRGSTLRTPGTPRTAAA